MEFSGAFTDPVVFVLVDDDLELRLTYGSECKVCQCHEFHIQMTWKKLSLCAWALVRCALADTPFQTKPMHAAVHSHNNNIQLSIVTDWLFEENQWKWIIECIKQLHTIVLKPWTNAERIPLRGIISVFIYTGNLVNWWSSSAAVLIKNFEPERQQWNYSCFVVMTKKCRAKQNDKSVNKWICLFLNDALRSTERITRMHSCTNTYARRTFPFFFLSRLSILHSHSVPDTKQLFALLWR